MRRRRRRGADRPPRRAARAARPRGGHRRPVQRRLARRRRHALEGDARPVIERMLRASGLAAAAGFALVAVWPAERAASLATSYAAVSSATHAADVFTGLALLG